MIKTGNGYSLDMGFHGEVKVECLINASDKIMFENQEKKRKYGHKSNLYMNFHLKDRLDI